MTTTAWPTFPVPEMTAFAYDGWSILRIGATPNLPLTYEATHPEIAPGDVLVAHSLGEVRDLIDAAAAAYVTDPLGPDTGTWTWTRTSTLTRKDA